MSELQPIKYSYQLKCECCYRTRTSFIASIRADLTKDEVLQAIGERIYEPCTHCHGKMLFNKVSDNVQEKCETLNKLFK